jgi:hypothetical protein
MSNNLFQHSTTVRELVQKLNQYPSDAVVIVSSDAEGNSHSPLDDVSSGVYVADSTWSGELSEHSDPESDNERLAIVLWPIR